METELKQWLVYLLSACEMGSEGWSGWLYYCVAEGNKDEDIYKSWLENVNKIYNVDLSEDLKCRDGYWSCYYPLEKIELPKSVYGHSQPLELIVNYNKHKN